MKNEPIGPFKDYVNRGKSRKLKQRMTVLYTVLAIPVVIALFGLMLAPAGENLRYFFTGITLGYIGQATLVYTLNFISSLIKGACDGV